MAGSTNTKIMRDWVSNFLRVASGGDILLMDNLNSHHSIFVLDPHLRATGITVLFTSAGHAYLVSPLDNFIFAFMKNQWRKWVTNKGGLGTAGYFFKPNPTVLYCIEQC